MHRLLLVSLSLLTFACATATTTPSQSLAKLADEYWQRQLADALSTRAELGLPLERLPDLSHESAQRDAAFASSLLARLARVEANQLTDDERISLGILKHRNELAIDGLPHFYHSFRVTPYASPIQPVNQVLTRFTFRTREDLQTYLKLLDQYDDFLGQIETIAREQQRRGILVPKPELAIVRASLQNPPPLNVADARLTAFSSEDRIAFQSAVTNALDTKIIPALTRLREVFSAVYEASAPETVGVSQYPGGAEAYRYFIRASTTLDLKPQDIHDLGVREVERINAAMARVRESLGFRGTKREFHDSLRKDPRLFAKTPEEIGERLMTYVRKVEPHIPCLFAKTPRAPYDVKRLDPALEGAITFGYYQWPNETDPTGHYFYNGSKVNERSLLSAGSLMLHELVPGHHFQTVRQMENESIPLFRRKSFDTVFLEGWGEYAANLGWELGVFDDPYDAYGRHMLDMMIAVRLVVDSGMNALGWSRARAMDYMREHTLLSDTEIATETLRYSVDIPGQALAYKIGSLRMNELRKRAEGKADVRDFHEWMIGHGSMPLPVLEEHITRKLNQAARRAD